MEQEIDIEIDELLELEEPNFNSTIIGNFGSFHTSNSYEVNYLLTSMNAKQIDDIEVAAEAFKFDQVNFDEMIQREIDERRVNDEIVSEYLEDDLRQALFFPPLIVSVVAFDDDNKPLHRYEHSYESMDTKGKFPLFSKRWDRHFEIQLPVINKGADFYKSEKHGDLQIYPNAVKLKLDKTIVKLVIIDGQHRYKALKEYLRRHPDNSRFLNIPICICFSPKAMERNGPEDILDTLRNMFVTINNTGKRVSGHYLDLLNDNSLASQTVRMLANKWKKEDKNPLNSKLQFIEWNQRSDTKSRRVNRAHSITTVSMLCESLRKSIFIENKDVDYLYNLLALSQNKEKLENDNSSIHNISESNFTHDQKENLYKLIEEKLIEPLEILLTQPSVYKVKIESYNLAMSDCYQLSQSGKTGYPSFIKVMSKFGDVDKKFNTEECKSASDYFYKQIRKDEHLDNYTRLVFNQAYLRVWTEIANINPLVSNELVAFTKIFVEALENLAFSPAKKVFSKSRLYNQFTLYKANKPNVTAVGKDCWFDLLMITLLDVDTQTVFKTFFKKYEKNNEMMELLNSKISFSVDRFVTRLQDEIVKDNNKNWRLKEYPLSFRNELSELELKADEDSLILLTKKLTEKSNEFFEERKELLANILGVKTSDLGR